MENKILSFEQFSSIYESEFYLGESESSGDEIDLGLDNLGVDPEDIADVMSNLDPKPLEEATPPKTGTTVSPYKAILPGEKGERVKWLQQTLGFKGADVDGDYGKKTTAAVADFQRKNGLTVDGKVGDQTLKKMVDVYKTPQQEIDRIKRIPVKTSTDAAKAGLDPRLLDLYDIYLVFDGKGKKIILIPKAGSQEKAKQIKKTGIPKGLEMLIEGVKYLGKAIVYTGKGIFLITTEAANAIINGIVSISKMVASGLAYAVGVAVQGLVKLGKWLSEMGQKAWQGIKDATQQIWKEVCEAVAILGKASLGILYAFMAGVKAVAITFTGIALKIWKAIKSQFDEKIQAFLQTVDTVEKFMEESIKQIGAKIEEVKKKIGEGYKQASEATKKAWENGKKAVQKYGEDVVQGTKEAYEGLMKFFQDSYDEGKKVWESTMFDVYDSEFLYENHQLLEFEEIDFSLEYDWRL